MKTWTKPNLSANMQYKDKPHLGTKLLLTRNKQEAPQQQQQKLQNISSQPEENDTDFRIALVNHSKSSNSTFKLILMLKM